MPTGYNYYACWQGLTVKIVYKDVGGARFTGIHATGKPTTHTNGIDTVLLEPSKLYYTFVGWYLNSAGTGSPVTKISAADSYTSMITVYAKWREVTFAPVIKTSIIEAKYITDDGSYIDIEGNLYLVEEDIEAYLNGTLAFYKKEENNQESL